MPKLPDLQVVIPYKTLLELLESAKAVSDLRKEIKIRDDQILALRNQLSEVFDVIGQLREEIRLLD